MMAARAPKVAKKVVKKAAPKKAAPKKVVKKAAPKKAAPKKAAPAKKKEQGVRFWAPGFGPGPLPNGGQIFFSEWSDIKQAFAMELIGGAKGNVKSPGGKAPLFGGLGLPL